MIDSTTRIALRFPSNLYLGVVLLLTALGTTVPGLAQTDAGKPAAQESDVGAYYVRFTPGRAAITDRAVRELGGELTHRLDRVHSVAITLPRQAVDALGRRPGIELIEPVPEYRIQAEVVPYNIDQYQARDIWDRNRDNVIDSGAPDGSGVKFCIIDTGFHGPHDDFVGTSITGFSQISGENWFEDGNGHGTHVAGTANAVMNDIGVVGTMPGGAALHIVKAFNNSGNWVIGQSNLGAAIQECADRDANVISMSLGGGGASATEEALFQSLYDTGVPGDDGIIAPLLSVAAAGNGGNNAASYPASYESVISVAAIDEAELVASFSQYPATAYDPNNPPPNVEWDVVELSGGGVNVLSTYPFPDGSVPAYQAIGTQTFSGSHIDESGFGDVTAPLVDGGFCEAGSGDSSWNGAVVICSRGNVSFSVKVNEVRDNGGLAAIIYNNAAGGFAGTCGGGCTAPLIPAISLSQADGQALIADDLGASVRVVADDGSSCTTCNGGYAFLSGTSMATPGVAAALALAWDACGGPATVTNKDIRQLLRDSAKDLTGTHGGGGGTYGPGWDPATGWGLIQLADARELGNTRFGGACPIGLQVAPAVADVCAADGSTNLTVTLDDQFLGSATLSATGNPAGTSGAFSPNPLLHPDKDSIYTLSNLGAAAGGSYTISFTATDDSDPANTADGQALLNLVTAAPAGGVLTGPANGSTGVTLRPTLTWTAASEAAGYELQISTSPTFDTITYSASVTGTSHVVASDLDSTTTYYWRVRASNTCGNGSWFTSSSFTTTALVCTVVSSTDVPVAIQDATGGGTPRTTESTLGTSIADPIDSINVIGLQGTHTWINDLSFDLVSPAGTTVRIMNQSCTNEDNFDLSLSDSATGTWPCPPVGGGTYQPSNPLSSFDGQSPAGTWTLRITDNFRADTGTLNAWALEFCVVPPGGPAPTTTTIDSITPATIQTVGQPYTVAVSVSGASPTGTVNVSDGTDSCTINLPDASCDLTSTTTGAKTIAASYSGDADDAPSSGSAAYSVVQASSTTNITNIAPAGSQAYNTPYTVEVSVAGYAPTGTVTVSDGNGSSCDIVLPATSCALASTVVGAITISATYQGDANNTSSSALLPYEITTIPATITFADLTQTYTGGQLGATVTTSPAGLATSVTYDGGPEPTAAGSYTVVATITEPGYTGSATDTFTITPAPATVTLSNLTQAFDGSPKPVTVTTVPASLPVEVTYDGATTAPSAVGTYAVVATVTDPNYTGSASGTLEITAATATVTLGSLSQVYDGAAKDATATTDPVGLAVTFTYDGSPAAPTGVGSYAVVATVDDPNYTGSASGTLELTEAATTVSIDALAPAGQQVAGQAYTVTVSVAGANPTGTVTVDDGHGVTCQFDLPATGCQLTSVVIGPTTVSADYAGDANHGAGMDSIAYEIVPGSATDLAFTVQPSDVQVGQTIAPAVQVEVRDALANPVADGTVVMLALGANPGGGSLTGTLNANTTGGVATFADLAIDTAGTGYTLVASSGAGSAESGAFGVISPAVLTISPALLDFGAVEVGSASTVRTTTLQNAGGVALNVSAIDVAAAPFESIPGQTTCPSTPFELAAGSSCDLAFRFTPGQEGASTADVSAFSDAGSAAITLSGEGVTLPQLAIVGPTSIDFGDLDIGDTSPAELIVIENLGDGDLVIDAIELVGQHGPQYLLDWNVAGMCGAGEVLASGAFCGFEVRYAPVIGGVQEARIRIRSNDAGGPHWIDVRGTADVAFHDGFETAL